MQGPPIIQYVYMNTDFAKSGRPACGPHLGTGISPQSCTARLDHSILLASLEASVKSVLWAVANFGYRQAGRRYNSQPSETTKKEKLHNDLFVLDTENLELVFERDGNPLGLTRTPLQRVDFRLKKTNQVSRH